MQIENLIRFIESHGNQARAEDGKIVASVVMVERDGRVHTEWETVEPSLQAVRDWLGY